MWDFGQTGSGRDLCQARIGSRLGLDWCQTQTRLYISCLIGIHPALPCVTPRLPPPLLLTLLSSNLPLPLTFSSLPLSPFPPACHRMMAQDAGWAHARPGNPLPSHAPLPPPSDAFLPACPPLRFTCPPPLLLTCRRMLARYSFRPATQGNVPPGLYTIHCKGVGRPWVWRVWMGRRLRDTG